MKHPADPTAHRPLPRALVALTGFIALVEMVLWMGDSGILFDPSLRLRVMGAGAFWSPLLHGAEPLFWSALAASTRRLGQGRRAFWLGCHDDRDFCDDGVEYRRQPCGGL